ncbi:MAG: ABC transporter ATP-binding protein [Methylococcaceae bacterium]|nr:ABC transporter ATP-binding protein [Methylococcaceae bacterium]
MDALIKVESLVRYYGSQCAVRDVSFSLDEGEVVGFLGPNGAGKSTTLNMISGNLSPDSGRILIKGVDIVNNPVKAKGFLGYLPDIPPVYFDSTVDEYLRFCAKIHRIATSRLTHCLEAAKRRCGLSEVGRRLIANLSKGYRQRLGVAQAILHSPALIILDEPWVGLDPIQIREMRELILELGRSHGVILSSHILSEVQDTCTRTLMIHQGRLILDTDIAGLEQSIENASLLLKTRRPADPGLLMQIHGVDSVEGLNENSYRIKFRKNHDPAEEISQTAVKSGWGLLELRAERGTIEELFIQLAECGPVAENAVS